jgi:DNA adenine methylase
MRPVAATKCETVSEAERHLPPRSFLRWAGSKRLLLKHLIPLIPESYGTYFEPFVGSASLYFHLRPNAAVLNDKATEVIDLYSAIKKDVEEVLAYCGQFENSKEAYYDVRANRSTNPTKRAAEFLFLNKTCWNGLFRVNASGGFNVPYGDNKVAQLVDLSNLRSCAQLMAKTDVALLNGDFGEAVREAKSGDFVYFDPPYVTGHNNNGFLHYNEKIFSWDDQIRLSKLAKNLVNRGVHVVISNADHDDVAALYEDFDKTSIQRNSTISGSIDKRGPISEVIFHFSGQNE